MSKPNFPALYIDTPELSASYHTIKATTSIDTLLDLVFLRQCV